MKHFMRFLSALFFLLILVTRVYAAVDYAPWANVLKNYVDSNGRVDYSGLKKDRVELQQFVDQLARTDISRFTADEAKAFWINAYNALTLKAVTDKYPVKSIRRIWRVWDTSKDVAFGQYTLNDIEHEIVRPMGDPRVHFALNCASIGCPRLPNKPFYPETLNEQLNQEAARFINDPEKVRLDLQNNAVYVSSIFKWFKGDFLKASPDIWDFIKQYLHPKTKAMIVGRELEVRSLGYDWDLNDRK